MVDFSSYFTNGSNPLVLGDYANTKNAFSSALTPQAAATTPTTGYTPTDLSWDALWGSGSGSSPVATAAVQPDWMTTLFGGTDSSGFKTSGVVSPMVGLGTAGMNAYLGMENLNLAEDSLAFQKDAFSKQFATQQSLTNSQLRDRQTARVSADPNAYQAVDAYMKENGV